MGVIREAREGDLGSILMLLHQLSQKKEGEETSEEVLRDIIQDPAYRLIVYEEDEKIIGTAMLFVQRNLSHGGSPVGHIENVVSDTAARGKGIGKKLTDYLVHEAKSLGCYKRILDCSEQNAPFYEKCGFRRTGEVQMRND